MIQRIQSLWLLLAFIISGAMFFLPLSELLTTESEQLILDFNSIDNAENGKIIHTAYSLAGLLGIVTFLNFVGIFLFKKRNLQMRLCIFNSLLSIGTIALIAYFSYFTVKNTDVIPGIAAVLPFIVFIFLLMARRAIKKDEELVRSVDRIR